MELMIIIMFVIGVQFLFVTGVIVLIDLARRRRCTASTTATVTKIKRINLGRHSHRVVCRITYEYDVDGVRYINTKTIYKRDAPSGSTVSIAYTPKEPWISHIPDTSNKVYETIVVALASIGLSVIFVAACETLFVYSHYATV